MAPEITCASRLGPRLGRLGGHGWLGDEATVIGELEAGRRYYVRVGAAQVDVVLGERDGRPELRTDPTATAANELLSLPPCP